MPYEIVVVGTSLGGLAALETLFLSLPPSFSVPIAVVQHRMADSRSRLPGLLQQYTKLTVKEPQDKEPHRPGVIYIAPADYHLMVEDGVFSLSTDAPVMSARPSIDVLFESAADALDEGVIGVVLTGASADGAQGAARIKERGGKLIVQDPATAESGVMPRSAGRAAKPDWILPITEIGPRLVEMVTAKEKHGQKS